MLDRLDELGGRERAIVRLVDTFVLHPGEVDDELPAELLATMEPAQIVELVVILAAFLGFSKLRIALGLVPDEMDVRVVPTPDLP